MLGRCARVYFTVGNFGSTIFPFSLRLSKVLISKKLFRLSDWNRKSAKGLSSLHCTGDWRSGDCHGGGRVTAAIRGTPKNNSDYGAQVTERMACPSYTCKLHE